MARTAFATRIPGTPRRRSALLRRHSDRDASVGTRAVQFGEATIEPFEQEPIARVPVFDVTAFAGLVEVFTRVPQLFGGLPLDDVERLQPDVAQRLNLGLPEHRVLLDLGLD